ncbi:DgyrCDS12427 [Dimorphilus gyrociliatus]|uniref:separase n=1 Tax=Dimorphilus gyrociliatus TaxID=2664684 RepID=A0A7I8W7M7_9ANNE|nr:DgyrCDS12427 [Dimorphilus gyrociliatus]
MAKKFNYCKVILSYSNGSGGECDTDSCLTFRFQTEDYLNSLRFTKFGKTLEDHKDLIQNLPKDYCICQLSVAQASTKSSKRLFLTRYHNGCRPIIIPIGGFEQKECQKKLERFKYLIKEIDYSTTLTDKDSFWKTRRKLDEEVKVLMNGSSYLTRTKLSWLIDVYCEYNDLCVDNGKFVDSLLEMDISVSSDKPLILIVDRQLQHIPFENMPFCRDSIKVYRMPSINCVLQHYNLMNKEPVQFDNAYYIVDPDDTLTESQENLVPFLKSLGWNGASGKLPIWEELKRELECKDIFLYAGHGSGSQCFSKEELYRLKTKSMAILMGCSSVQLTTEGEFDASGRTVLNYLSSGCSSIMGNMWKVTDKDIDLFTKEQIRSISLAERGEFVPFICNEARENCNLKYLTGASPVIYGLPLQRA